MEWYNVNVLGSRVFFLIVVPKRSRLHEDIVAKLLSEAFTRYY